MGWPGNETAQTFAHAVFDAYWRDGRDISDVAVLSDVARAAGIDPAEITAAEGDADAATAVREAGEQAVEAGVFGTPFCIVDGEPFWGQDRIDHLDWFLGQPK